ncbi:methyl-accepting chemotaxis protein [Neorhizobium lilium]|uniref:Methyl-accepting chemotaxis protein n=1 Tax=Neorhizobium lilium TaxID=2503024 RepID=A0A3S3S5H4_9HYPH|nr:methyl-accepting chemotaxis protein [Neorhizobium lilium]RWX77304.1 methyl-accepting chemotaxis protein [Neorhizobium lilium]
MTELHIKRPLWMTITGCGFAAVLFASAAIGGLAWYRQSAALESTLDSEAVADRALIQNDMAAQKKAASALALALAGEPDVADLITQGARDQIVPRYASAMPAINSEGNLSLITFVGADGKAVARIHTPEKFGDDMTGRRKTVGAALSSGKLVAGTEPGLSGVSMFASAPVIKAGKTVGVVDVGTILSNSYFKPLAKQIQGEVGVYIFADGKFQKQASTSDRSFLTDDQVKAAFDGQRLRDQVTFDGKTYLVEATPFTNFSGDKIGVLEVSSDVTKIVTQASSATMMTVVGTIVISILALLGFLFFARALAGTISRLTGTMSNLASGNLAAVVEGDRRADEIGAMARAVQVFKDNALKSQELERQADEQRNQSEEQRRSTAERDRVQAQAMAQATNGLADGLKHLAAGDLTFQLAQPFAQDFESLREDFNRAVEQLRSTLSGVAQATGSIDSGAREVSSSADDLSKRTEQQAASLEETAAALDQITANVSNSSKRADEARAVAIQANESARHSGQVVASAVGAMGKIEQSSSQISNIIGVIDDIAFQTNLLALNAGVEAARAGEAGKGFAVVAQEVRELAQRSAKAAKEIKELIRNSSVEVGSGVKLVSETGEALKTIEAYIVTINQHMDAIATSAREQSVGLSEVNTAVNQMDQVTQQNAAMVEEANAAGATLANEAGRLRDMIAQFQLGNAASSQTAALRRTSAALSTASSASAPAPSPARGMVGRIAKAFTGRSSAAAAAAPSADSWEEF